MIDSFNDVISKFVIISLCDDKRLEQLIFNICKSGNFVYMESALLSVIINMNLFLVN